MLESSRRRFLKRVITGAGVAARPAIAAQSAPGVRAFDHVALPLQNVDAMIAFYRALGFTIRYGGEHASFTSLHAGSCYLNLAARVGYRRPAWWGQVIFYVSDVDAFYDAGPTGAGRVSRGGHRPAGHRGRKGDPQRRSAKAIRKCALEVAHRADGVARLLTGPDHY